MERLTDKINVGFGTFYRIKSPRFVKEYISADDKLGQKEDDDEELGIDSHILFKALKDGIWFKHKSPFLESEKPIIFSQGWKLKYNEPTNRYFLELGSAMNKVLYDKEDWLWELAEFKDYGKTWALTKEELE